MRFLFWTSCIALGIAIGYGIIYAFSVISPFTLQPTGSGTARQIDYSDFISVMLTAVSIILVALGFVVAILAFIGWNSIGDRVNTLALSFLKESLKEGGQLHKLVKDEAKQIIYRGVEPVDTEFDEDDSINGGQT